MECNKDEAMRAKAIAEKKMAANDFEGARKIAIRAQNLYPELENISQLLSICDVHCSAQQSILGSEKDWYGILQAQRLADESIIKKQYRRLALVLHPDKNRFPGAEAAFKLICEANAVLSDTGKKAIYDSKVRSAVKFGSVNPAPRQLNKNAQFNKQPGSHKDAQFSKQQGSRNNVANGFSNLNQQARGSSFSARDDVFWTCCPFCSTKYQYHRQFVNRSLRCPTCMKAFMACEIGPQNPLRSKMGDPGAHVPSKPGTSRPAVFQEKVVPDYGNSKMGVQNNKGSTASHASAQGIAGSKTFQSDPVIQTGSGPEEIRVASACKERGDPKAKEQDGYNANSMHGGKESGKSNGFAINREPGAREMSRRGRKLIVESSESSDTSSDSDKKDTIKKEKFGDPGTEQKSEPSEVTRRSLRRKQNVTYNESEDDDTASPLKRQKASNTSEDGKGQNDARNGEDLKLGNLNGSAGACYGESNRRGPGDDHPQQNMQEKNAKHDKEDKTRSRTGGLSSNGAETVTIEGDPDLDTKENSDKDRCECPDPEFNDFEKGRDVSQFKVGQYWACYDPSDGMPRFYAMVKKVSLSPFEVSIKWLEAEPISKAFQNWVDKELPVGCGTFKFGTDDKISELDTFSHEVEEVQKAPKGKKRFSLIHYPRKGEVWALFKNWNMSWSLEPDSHKKFKYVIVEVLSDFVQGTGVRVGYLDKVEGFVSLFQRTGKSEADFLIGADEVYKFSHRVPSFKMTGSERKGVPADSFELDPASLPSNPDDLYFPVKAKIENRNLDTGVPLKSNRKKGKTAVSESPSSRKDFVDLDGIDEETLNVRRSPRGLNFIRKNTN